MWQSVVIVVIINSCTVNIKCQFYACHDDPGYNPQDGTVSALRFTWLGALQYIQVKSGHPHYYRVPRVVLISRQFALCTANDAANIPEGYALGNVAFGEYERDEVECSLTTNELEDGVSCEPAILLVPIADVLLHPEYKHFHVNHSVALLKLVTTVKSKYMLPLCLPFKDYLKDQGNPARSSYRFLNVDFSSDVPRDFVEEEKEAFTVQTLNTDVCRDRAEIVTPRNFRVPGVELPKQNASQNSNKRVVCSSECGFHSGAPTIIHEHTGHWSLVTLAAERFMCPDPLRTKRQGVPHHIAIYDYVSWITAAISGKTITAFADDDPFGFVMPRTSRIVERGKTKWVGHWWMGGLRCYDRGEAAEDLYKFYHEVFFAKPTAAFHLTYFLEINSPETTLIACVKIGMPYANRGEPRVWNINSATVKVRIPMIHFTKPVRFNVEAWGYNASSAEDSDE